MGRNVLTGLMGLALGLASVSCERDNNGPQAAEVRSSPVREPEFSYSPVREPEFSDMHREKEIYDQVVAVATKFGRRERNSYGEKTEVFIFSNENISIEYRLREPNSISVTYRGDPVLNQRDEFSSDMLMSTLDIWTGLYIGGEWETELDKLYQEASSQK